MESTKPTLNEAENGNKSKPLLVPVILKVYELRPIENLHLNDYPWDPWYDKNFGFIIRAENEKEAREIFPNTENATEGMTYLI